MKITNVEEKKRCNFVYIVTLTPNWLDKLVGNKEKQCEYIDTGNNYGVSGIRIYSDKEGNLLENYHPIAIAIDKWRRRQDLHYRFENNTNKLITDE